jgi:hypothetical protein
VEDLLRRISSLRTDLVALVGTSLACLVMVASFVVAVATGMVKLSAVAGAVTFLLIVGIGLYASRLGAPGRST